MKSWIFPKVGVMFVLDNLVWFLVILFYGIFAIIKPSAMLNMGIIIFIFYVMTTIGLLVLAESIALLSGNFDVSIDRITGFTAILAAKLITTYHINPYLGIFLPIGLGFMCGSFNGLLVGVWELNPFISTLATSLLFSGLVLITSYTNISNLPRPYLYVGGNMGASILIFFCILVFFWFFLRYSRLGRNIYSTGGNPSAALMLGINRKRTIFITYCIVGTICGIAALFYTGFDGCAPINMATNALFPAMAGAVIGGISLKGGRGSVINAFAGGLLFAVVNAGLAMFAVAEEIRILCTGLLVIIAIIIGSFREIVREKTSKTL